MLILPIPKKEEYAGGCVVLRKNPSVYCTDEDVRGYIIKNVPCVFSDNENSDIVFKMNTALKKEEYTVDVSETGIVSEGGSNEALFRAASTLKQVIAQAENGNIPKLHISDCPDLKNRGIMLDVSRGKIPKRESVFRLIDIMADLKYNQLQLYFDNIVFEYQSLREYYRDIPVMTIEDIKEIDEYCRKNFIMFVPNQNSLGHLQGWLAKDEFSYLAIEREDGKKPTTINPLHDDSLRFIERLYDDLLPHYNAPYMHIGMDEPWELGMGQTEEACKKYGRGKVYTDYLKKLCKLGKDKYNIRSMFWDDIVMKYPEFIKEIPKDCIVVDWGYETESRYEKRCMQLREAELEYYVAPGTSTWESITGRITNALYNIQSAASAGSAYGASGLLLTDWGDGGHVSPMCMSYIQYAVGAAFAWNSCYWGDEFEQCKWRIKILDESVKYVDMFILKSAGKSVADIIYRLGRTYLMEQNAVYNETQLSRLARIDIDDTELEGINPVYFKNIERYVSEIKAELETCEMNCEDGSIVKEEIKMICDMAIFMAQAVQICAGRYNHTEYNAEIQDTKPLKENFEELWKTRNLNRGFDIFERRLDGIAEKVKKEF